MATTFLACWMVAVMLTHSGLAFIAGLICAAVLLTWTAVCPQQNKGTNDER